MASPWGPTAQANYVNRSLVLASYSTYANTAWMAGSTTSGRSGFGVLFENVDIPQGALVQSAYFAYTPVLTASLVAKAFLQIENVDSAAAWPADAATFDTRRANVLAEQVDWSPVPTWTAPTVQYSPDIAAMLQAQVGRAGWASGNALGTFHQDWDNRTAPTSTSSAWQRRVGNFATTPVRLYATYTEGSSYKRPKQRMTSLGGF